MRLKQAAAGGMALLLVAGCAPRPAAPPPSPPPSTPVAEPAAASAPPSTSLPVLPDATELKQELAIVSSPQVSRERSLSAPGHVQDLGGAWVRYGPMLVGGIRPVLEKTGHADVPLRARLVVTRVQSYSDVCPTKLQAARAPLPYTQERTTTYLYDYQATGTWALQDQKDGALIDLGKGGRP